MNVNDKSPTKKAPYGIQRKSVARLAAVQALYSYEISADIHKTPAHLVVEAMGYQGEDEENNNAITPDEKCLKKLIYGAFERKDEIDTLIQQHLGNGWEVERLGGVMYSLLRVGVCELLEFPNLSIKTLVNEYINLARGFMNEQEVKFVNGILDKIGHKLRD